MKTPCLGGSARRKACRLLQATQVSNAACNHVLLLLLFLAYLVADQLFQVIYQMIVAQLTRRFAIDVDQVGG